MNKRNKIETSETDGEAEKPYPLNPAAERKRIEAVRSFGILDSGPEPAFDQIVQIVSHICGTPMALVSILDSERQWFKAGVGLDAEETPREHAFCEHVICDSQPMAITDARSDPRFSENPFVVGAPWIRAYVGAPLVTKDGHALGTVCAIDTKPRIFGAAHIEALESLARCSVAMLEVRKLTNPVVALPRTTE